MLRKGEKRRLEILSAAGELLSTKGSMNFSMRAVAEMCNIRLSNLQHYFPSIDALLGALLEKILDDAEKRLDEVRLQKHDEFIELANIITASLQDTSYCKLVCEVWNLSEKYIESKNGLTCFYIRYVKYVKKLIQRRIPELADPAAKQKAIMMVALFEGLSVLYTNTKDALFDFDLESCLIKAIHSLALYDTNEKQ